MLLGKIVMWVMGLGNEGAMFALPTPTVKTYTARSAANSAVKFNKVYLPRRLTMLLQRRLGGR